MKKRLLLLATLAATSIATVQAALPDSVATDLADVKTDVGTIGSAVLLIVVAITAFKMLRKGAS